MKDGEEWTHDILEKRGKELIGIQGVSALDVPSIVFAARACVKTLETFAADILRFTLPMNFGDIFIKWLAIEDEV